MSASVVPLLAGPGRRGVRPWFEVLRDGWLARFGFKWGVQEGGEGVGEDGRRAGALLGGEFAECGPQCFGDLVEPGVCGAVAVVLVLVVGRSARGLLRPPRGGEDTGDAESEFEEAGEFGVCGECPRGLGVVGGPFGDAAGVFACGHDGAVQCGRGVEGGWGLVLGHGVHATEIEGAPHWQL